MENEKVWGIDTASPLSRRNLLRQTGIAATCAALFGCSPKAEKKAEAKEVPTELAEQLPVILTILSKRGVVVEKFGSVNPKRIFVCAGQVHGHPNNAFELLSDETLFTLYREHHDAIFQVGHELQQLQGEGRLSRFYLGLEGLAKKKDVNMKESKTNMVITTGESWKVIDAELENNADFWAVYRKKILRLPEKEIFYYLNQLNGSLRLAGKIYDQSLLTSNVIGLEHPEKTASQRYEDANPPFNPGNWEGTPEKIIQDSRDWRIQNYRKMYEAMHSYAESVLHDSIPENGIVYNVIGDGHVERDETNDEITLQDIIHQRNPDDWVIYWKPIKTDELHDEIQRRWPKPSDEVLQKGIRDVQERNRRTQELIDALDKGLLDDK